jgi:hypothetical protein
MTGEAETMAAPARTLEMDENLILTARRPEAED